MCEKSVIKIYCVSKKCRRAPDCKPVWETTMAFKPYGGNCPESEWTVKDMTRAMKNDGTCGPWKLMCKACKAANGQDERAERPSILNEGDSR